jgi:hypothetical protein
VGLPERPFRHARLDGPATTLGTHLARPARLAQADLEKVGTDRPIVIGFHHWIARETVMVDNEQELLELVAPYNVVLWLQGHGHSDIQWNINGAAA